MVDDTSEVRPNAPSGGVGRAGDASGATDAEGPRARGRGRSEYATRDLTKGSIRKNLWFLGWPQIAEGFLGVVDQIADLFWAGRIGFQAIAGLGVAQSYLMMVITARMGLDAGMRSMISRAVGAGQTAYANHVLLQSLTLTSFIAIFVILLGVLLTEPMLRVVGLSEAVVSQAAPYMRVQFFAMSVMSYQRLAGGALQAAGDSITPLRAAAVTRVLHLVLSPILIFGWLGAPPMGLAGAAMANLLAQGVGVAMNMYALFRGTSRLHLTFEGYYIDWPLLGRIMRIGAPASVTGMQRSVSQLIVVGIVAQFGDAAVAAFALTRRSENLVNQSSRGMGRAAGALAGQNLGAGYTDRAKASVLWALIYITGISLPIVIIFLAFPEVVASFFNTDSKFVSLATVWISIAALGYLAMSAVQVYTQAFNTSGSTFAPMVVTVLTMWAVELPLCYFLAFFTPLREFGVAWAIVIGMVLRFVVFTWYYQRGKWLRTGMM